MTLPLKPASARAPSLKALFVVSMIDVLGFGVLIPLVPYMAHKYGAGPTLTTAILGSYSLCQLLAAPIWGRLSDRYGRRPDSHEQPDRRLCLSYVILGFANSLWMRAGGAHAGGLHGWQSAGRLRLRFGCQHAGDARQVDGHGRRRHRHRFHARDPDRRHPGRRSRAERELSVAGGGFGKPEPRGAGAGEIPAAGKPCQTRRSGACRCRAHH